MNADKTQREMGCFAPFQLPRSQDHARTLTPDSASANFYERAPPVRSNSVMARSMSSRAESAEERTPWTRRRKSSGFEARRIASSKVMRLREYKSKSD